MIFTWESSTGVILIEAPDQDMAYRMAIGHLSSTGVSVEEAVGTLAKERIAEPAIYLSGDYIGMQFAEIIGSSLPVRHTQPYSGELPDEVEAARMNRVPIPEDGSTNQLSNGF